MTEEGPQDEGEDDKDLCDRLDEAVEKGGWRPGEKRSDYEPTQEQKDMVLKFHKAVGHPQVGDMVRVMRAARVRGEIVQWASRHFQCPTCQARPKPKVVRPAVIPRTYQPCRVVGIDLVFLPETGGEGSFPALSMVDWGLQLSAGGAGDRQAA